MSLTAAIPIFTTLIRRRVHRLCAADNGRRTILKQMRHFFSRSHPDPKPPHPFAAAALAPQDHPWTTAARAKLPVASCRPELSSTDD
jgi:hypothetical protein